MSKLDRDEGWSAAGPSLLEMLEEDLDDAVLALMTLIEKPKHTLECHKERSYAEGVAYGLARAVAVIRSPYDVEAGERSVRGAAMLRYKNRNIEPGGTHDEADQDAEGAGGGEGDR